MAKPLTARQQRILADIEDLVASLGGRVTVDFRPLTDEDRTGVVYPKLIANVGERVLLSQRPTLSDCRTDVETWLRTLRDDV